MTLNTRKYFLSENVRNEYFVLFWCPEQLVYKLRNTSYNIISHISHLIKCNEVAYDRVIYQNDSLK